METTENSVSQPIEVPKVDGAAVKSAGTASAQPPCRRVGTFTFGAVMVLTGIAMLLSMFFPELNMTVALQLSPLALVSLGIEVLLAARGSRRIKYDWVGMLLSCIIVCTALALFSVAWCAVHYPNYFCF